MLCLLPAAPLTVAPLHSWLQLEPLPVSAAAKALVLEACWVLDPAGTLAAPTAVVWASELGFGGTREVAVAPLLSSTVGL